MNTIEQIYTLEDRISKGLPPDAHFQACSALKSAYMAVGEKAEAYRVADRIILEGTQYIDGLDSVREKNKMMGILEGCYITKAPDDFHSYLVALEWRREPEKRFYLPRMSVMKPIADAWTDMFVHDKYDLMLFSMPPGIGKSTFGLFGCTWVGWRDPERCNLLCGYADKIVKGFYTEINSLYCDPEYNTHRIFPKLELVSQSAKDYTMDFTDIGRTATKRFQTFTARPIDGSLTGTTRCENLLYCDDLVRGIEEAMNPERLETLWQKYANDLASRKKTGCKEVHIGTRWSVHDPIGKLETMYGYSKRTLIFKAPALNERGESNFDYDYGVGFSTEDFENQKKKLDDISWRCLYQQEPIEREGLVFPEDELNRFYGYDREFLEKNPPDDIFAFVDVAFGGNDFLSMPIVAQWGEDAYVVDWVFTKGGYDVTQPLVKAYLCKWGVKRVTFEANNGGDFYARDIQDMFNEDPTNAHKILIGAQRAGTDKSKLTRILQHSPVIKEMRFLAEDAYPKDGMYRNAMKNLTTFTQNGKNQNDDAPDSLAGAATMIRYAGTIHVSQLSARPMFL